MQTLKSRKNKFHLLDFPQSKQLLFLTGTRADFGKIKPLMQLLQHNGKCNISIFVTGMHMLQRYGSTWEEVSKSKLGAIHPFVNQSPSDSMDVILAKTITGLSDFVKENTPDLIIVHGDRVEALAGAIVGALNNVKVAHIEGGELSGTVDELLRHSISKLAQYHFVANKEAQRRLVQMGEAKESIFVIGSPDVDAMESPDLPNLEKVIGRYGIQFAEYAILILHPVTTELSTLESNAMTLMRVLAQGETKIIVIESNNDQGSANIRHVYDQFRTHPNFKFFPSMRFEYFLSLLRNAKFIIGNSSAGVREAPHFGVPAIDMGSRQRNRVVSPLVLNTPFIPNAIKNSITEAAKIPRIPEKNFGDGKSAERFKMIIETLSFWELPFQKQFLDIRYDD